jgi:hypothetical protein
MNSLGDLESAGRATVGFEVGSWLFVRVARMANASARSAFAVRSAAQEPYGTHQMKWLGLVVRAHCTRNDKFMKTEVAFNRGWGIARK